MKASSAEWKKNVYEDNRKFVYKADITLSDGTVLYVDNSQIMQSGVSFSGATSESGVFSIGSMVSSKVTVRLNNMYDDFSNYDFTNATAYVYVGTLLSETTEWLKMGQFNVESPTTRTSIISLEMLDNLSKSDKVYVPKVTFPCTRLQLAQDACSQSGLYLNTTDFYGWNQSVAAFDITSTMTCRQILSYIAQVGCLYGMCDENGYLNFKWYDTALIDRFRTNIDGGNFTDYTSGTTANGGNFTDYSSGDVLDGGSFTDVDNVAYVYSIKSQEINTDDVVITGVKITYQYSDDETKELKVGTDGYVIGISENPLINKNNVQAIANYIYSIIGGLTFRPLTVNALADPRVEPGDIGVVIDSKQNVYPCIFTTLSVTYGGYETYTCDAESAARNSSDSFSAMTQAIVVARENTKKQITSYDQAVQRLTNLMTNCFGVFKTEEVQDDGSVVYYMHNKPSLADSDKKWKMTADAFAVWKDGEWKAGLDADGNAVVNVLDAIGINADWIKSGTISANHIQGGELRVGGSENGYGEILIIDSNDEVIGSIGYNSEIRNLCIKRLSANKPWYDYEGQIIRMEEDDLFNYRYDGDLGNKEPQDAFITCFPDLVLIGNLTNYLFFDRDTLAFGRKAVTGASGYLWSIDEDGNADFKSLKTIATGSVDITPKAANTPTGVYVSWNLRDVPIVTVTPCTSVPGKNVLGVGVRDVSAAGCTIYLTRTDTIETTINYIAIVNQREGE